MGFVIWYIVPRPYLASAVSCGIQQLPLYMTGVLFGNVPYKSTSLKYFKRGAVWIALNDLWALQQSFNIHSIQIICIAQQCASDHMLCRSRILFGPLMWPYHNKLFRSSIRPDVPFTCSFSETTQDIHSNFYTVLAPLSRCALLLFSPFWYPTWLTGNHFSKWVGALQWTHLSHNCI